MFDACVYVMLDARYSIVEINSVRCFALRFVLIQDIDDHVRVRR
jgi:hypothetical protein